MDIAIVAPCPIPYMIGGAENLWRGLQDHLNEHTSHQAELIKLPSRELEFWDLIDRMSDAGTTVLVTTHYLDEAEHCHRIAIIQAGKLAALGTTTELKQVFRDRPILEVQAAQPVAAMEALDALNEVEKTSLFGTSLHVVVRHADRAEDLIAQALQKAGVETRAISRVTPSLEDVFLDVVERTGGAS